MILSPNALQIYLGWDPKETIAYAIAEHTLRLQSNQELYVQQLGLAQVYRLGLYNRPTTYVDDRLFDVISQAPMSTEHAIIRFLVPYLNKYEGWALFCDSDILVRAPIEDLFALADPRYAVMCVQHAHTRGDATKKDGQIQQYYSRKNWSSVMLFNCGHPRNRNLTVNLVNEVPGRDLHAFSWLDDNEIGALPPEWNYLVGVTGQSVADPAIVHYTLGTPDTPGATTSTYDSDWFAFGRLLGYSYLRYANHFVTGIQ